MSDTIFQICENQDGVPKTIITIKPDGTIIKGEGFTTDDEASLKFWEAVERVRCPMNPDQL